MIRFALILLLVATVAIADPEITGLSGTVETDELVTIGGTGFGPRVVKVEIIDRFDWGELESAVDSATSPWVSMGAGNNDPVRFSDEFARGGVGLNVRAIIPDRNSGTELMDALYICGLDIDGGDHVYTQFFMKSNYAGARVNEIIDKPQQTKPYRFTKTAFTGPYFSMEWNGSGVTPPGRPAMYTKNQQGTGDLGGGEINIFAEVTGGAVDTTYWWSYEQEMLINTTSTALDGWFRSCVTQPEHDYVWEASRTSRGFWLSDDTEPYYDCFLFENYVQQHDPDVQYRLHFDDVVHVTGADALARVMLCNGSTPETSSLREYQEVTSWGVSSITVEIYTGGFLADEEGYLYVVHSDGTWSGGAPVTVGGTATGLAPPTALAMVRTVDSGAASWNAGNPHEYSQIEIKEDGRLKRIQMLFNDDTGATRLVNSATSLHSVIRAYDTAGDVQGSSSEAYTPPP